MKKLFAFILLFFACSMQAASLTFSVTEIEGGLRVTPSNNTDTYLWQLVNDESLAGMAKYVGKSSITVEEYWQAYIDLEWFFPAWDLNQGEIKLIYDEMPAMEDGEFTFIVAGCTEEGVRTSDFYKTLVTIGLKKDISFTITVSDVKMTEVTISAVPSESFTYYYDYIEAAALTDFSSEDAFAAAYVDFLKQAYPSNLSSKLFTEADTYTFTASDGIVSGVKYYAFALAIDMKDTTYVPTIKMVPFETLKQPLKENFTFDFSYDQATNKLTITPSLMDEYYYWAIFMDYEVEQKYAGSAEMAWLVNAPLYGGRYKSKGVAQINLTYECMWDGTYYLAVAGYNSGQTSEIVVETITIVDGKKVATMMPESTISSAVRKVMHDGRLYILRDNKLWDILGR